MDQQDYKMHLSSKLIKEFQDKFYEKIGIVPKVFLAPDGLSLSLAELNGVINGHIPEYLLQKGLTDIKVMNRSQPLNWLRAMFCSLAKSMGYSVSHIGQYLGRDHSTVIWNIRVFENLVLTDIQFRSVYNACLTSLNLEPIANEPTPLRAAA